MASGTSLSTTTRFDGAAAVVTASGELDVASVQRWVWAIDAALAERPAVLCLDVAAVTFAESAAVAALIRTRRITAWRGTALAVVTGDGPLDRLLGLTGMDRVLDRYPTVDDALRLSGGSLRAGAQARSAASSLARSSAAASATRAA